MYWFFTSCQLLAFQKGNEQDQMNTCDKCQSFYEGVHCEKCEQEFVFRFGLEASKNKKQEQLNIKWRETPNQNNCGRRES